MAKRIKNIAPEVLNAPDLTPEEIGEDVMLDIRNLTVHYEVDGDVVEAVSDVTLHVKKQKTLGLVGETGAGKTTTALAALNLIPDPPGIIKQGSIIMNGKTDEILQSGESLEQIFLDTENIAS